MKKISEYSKDSFNFQTFWTSIDKVILRVRVPWKIDIPYPIEKLGKFSK